jgi:hypothetical protein
VKRQLLVPLGVVWLAAVVAAWLVTMPMLALLIKVTGHHRTIGGLVGLAAISATFACVVVGGTVTAVALRLRRNHSPRHAAARGLATGAVVLLFFYSYVAAAGAPVTGAWKALLALVIISPAELALALALRRYCREDEPPETPPSKTPPDQPEASALTARRGRGLRAPGSAGGRSAGAPSADGTPALIFPGRCSLATRAVGALPASPLGVHHGLEVGPRPELWHIGLRYLDRRPGGRVTSCPGRASLLLEDPESRD